MKIRFLLLIFISGNSLFAQNDTTLYSFFVAGHTYGEPGVNNVGFHPPFKRKFDYIKQRSEIDFGILTGDIVSPYPTAQDWNEIDADIDKLGLPVYFAVGNHDMENRPLYEKRYGTTYYGFIHKNDLFIILDPNIDKWNISGEQLQFLQNIIKENSSVVDNIYVFFHQILWRESNNQFSYISWNSPAGRGDSINFWSTVEPIFRHLPNKVIMFAGDLGASWSTNVCYDSYDNITLIATGMGDEDGENFLVVNVGAEKLITYDLICLSDSNINCLGMLEDYLKVDKIGIESLTKNSYTTFIYPNPSVCKVTISQKVRSKTIIQFYNTEGLLILEEEFKGKLEYVVNVEHIAKGLYFVKIYNDHNLSTHKLIKMNSD